jgi:hypothetical protein
VDHKEGRRTYDIGDPIYFPCEKCVIFKMQTVKEIIPIKCKEHGVTIGYEYILECDSPCRFRNSKKIIQVYPC